jgi:hypothetical protein
MSQNGAGNGQQLLMVRASDAPAPSFEMEQKPQELVGLLKWRCHFIVDTSGSTGTDLTISPVLFCLTDNRKRDIIWIIILNK